MNTIVLNLLTQQFIHTADGRLLLFRSPEDAQDWIRNISIATGIPEEMFEAQPQEHLATA